MNDYTKELVKIFVVVAFVSTIVTALIAITSGYTQADIIFPWYFSIIAILLSNYVILSQKWQYHRQEEIRLRQEEIRHIEKSLENFYRPLQNLFIGYEQNPIDCYQEQKTKFLEIGCYKHLAEPKALLYFEKCPQDNESLKELIKQVMEDIDMLQKKYKEKSNNEGFFS